MIQISVVLGVQLLVSPVNELKEMNHTKLKRNWCNCGYNSYQVSNLGDLVFKFSPRH